MPGSIIAVEVFGLVAGTWAAAATAFAINMIASSIISKAFGPDAPNTNDGQGQQNPGNRQQVPPAGDNKVPVVYGSAYVGGIMTDLSITSNNQKMFYVFTLAEVTNTESDGTADTYTFGNVYWSGKKCVFDEADTAKVVGLLDESTGLTDTAVSGNMNIYLFSNGSSSGVNTPLSAIEIMQNPDLVYKWDSTKLMSNAAFAIIELTYNSQANITGNQQTKFQITNSRYKPGDCFSDYWQSTRYGAGLSLSEINTSSLDALNAYCDESFSYTSYDGTPSTQTRFRFDGTIDTNNTIMTNMQSMASCCDCLIKYNEISGQWGIITQKPTYTVSMAIDNSNMVSAIQVSPIDLASSYNIAEVKFPDGTAQDSFNSATFDLAVIDPALLYPNEPINKQTISLPLVNSSVRAQYLANRFLESAREDLQIKVDVDFSGIQLEAGDIVTLTNPSYGWVAKLFRVGQIVEKFGDDGSITASLTLMEFNPQVYDDKNITQFTPSPNTGIGDPLFFGTLYAPTISGSFPFAAIPSISVSVQASSSGITQYAEVWYSAYSSPTGSQKMFGGTTAVNPGGNPYTPSAVIGDVSLANIPSGDWYFFVRMVNSLGTSVFSSASSVVNWRPTTVQFTNRWITVAYASNSDGTSGFSFNPRGKSYFGLYNNADQNTSTDPTLYTWYAASPAFLTLNYLLFCNRGNNLMSFSTGGANYSGGTALFVPSDTSQYDQTIWQALVDGINIIDLNSRTGQLIQTGTTTVGTGEISIVNNPQGKVIASLAQLLTFPGGAYTKTAAVANLTIDVYGRVLGFESPDEFYYSMTAYDASSGQTVFSVTRGSEYLVGNCWVFSNGLLLNPSEYTDGASSVTLSTGAALDDIITIISFASVNTTTSTTYNSFTRNSVTLSNQASYTASGFTLVNGNELLFLNGTVVNAEDYDIFDQTITFIAPASGDLEVIQWTENNLSVPNGTPVNVALYTVAGQDEYSFAFDVNAFNLWNNGALLLETVDYAVSSDSYTLSVVPTRNTDILVQQTFSRTGAV